MPSTTSMIPRTSSTHQYFAAMVPMPRTVVMTLSSRCLSRAAVFGELLQCPPIAPSRGECPFAAHGISQATGSRPPNDVFVTRRTRAVLSTTVDSAEVRGS